MFVYLFCICLLLLVVVKFFMSLVFVLFVGFYYVVGLFSWFVYCLLMFWVVGDWGGGGGLVFCLFGVGVFLFIYFLFIYLFFYLLFWGGGGGWW